MAKSQKTQESADSQWHPVQRPIRYAQQEASTHTKASVRASSSTKATAAIPATAARFAQNLSLDTGQRTIAFPRNLSTSASQRREHNKPIGALQPSRKLAHG